MTLNDITLITSSMTHKYALNLLWDTHTHTHNSMSRYISVGIAKSNGLGGQNSNSRQGQNTFLFSTVFRLASGPTHLPIQWVLRAPSPRVKLLERQADHSPPSSAEVKNGGATPPPPHTS
jgi:hypothetical protein